MGRTRAFTSVDVTRAARNTFWEHGYEGTGIALLESKTGLTRSSLYNAYGSKRGLFDAAVDSYLDEVIRPVLAPLVAEQPTEDAIFTYLDTLERAFQSPQSYPARFGCLLVSAASAPIGQEDGVRAVVKRYRDDLAAAIDGGVIAAHVSAEQRPLISAACVQLVIAAFALARVDTQESVASLRVARELVRNAASTEHGHAGRA